MIVRKKIPSDVNFPFILIDQDTKKPEQELPSHLHDWHELIYIHKGKGEFYIHNRSFKVMSGDFVIIPQNTVHFSNPDATELITSTIIYFDPHLLEYPQCIDKPTCLNMLNNQVDFIYTISPEQALTFEHILHQIKEEMTLKKIDYKMAITLLLHMLLLSIYRHTIPTKGHVDTSPVPWLNESINHISSHFQSSLSLTFLAKQASVSPPHYSREFKRQMGVNVKEFIITKRISYVKKELRESHDTVETIAKKAGFQSMPYFFRTFNKYTGTTPNSFRKRTSL
ncbi:helix-turn-helix domain-containing protein [Halalkalibacter hemicellulosilyticus]|uniref:HTH araC/xylS-type domain-containing protein n=1 Tax=Halalkalibacter hemicellulosilyticusJCM 9152 TaxID=1236971 RepID=W4QFV5_9BACI|nr:AraC family transcriptional regulator [Halalkalibacter hemicellulosilyticus]GAE30234.1 hypothetical protein JCM9152_1635 [Halalkalibacter hemicellulosilyticusJCM 9152]